MQAYGLIAQIDKELSPGSFVRAGGSLLIMVGLPGAGKSYIVEHLQALMPAAVITTDLVRRFVRERPTYSAAEMAYIYEICYALVDRRLALGQRVIFDGSNYLAARRRRLVQIARRHRTAVALCQVQASEAVTRQRLSRRRSGERHESDYSDAGWPVYQWMVEAQEPIAVPHLILDTTTTAVERLAARLADYWTAREQQTEPMEAMYE